VPKTESPHELNFSKNSYDRVFFEYLKEELSQIPEKLITYAAQMYIFPLCPSLFRLHAEQK
jgi:hypothetical protein